MKHYRTGVNKTIWQGDQWEEGLRNGKKLGALRAPRQRKLECGNMRVNEVLQMDRELINKGFAC